MKICYNTRGLSKCETGNTYGPVQLIFKELRPHLRFVLYTPFIQCLFQLHLKPILTLEREACSKSATIGCYLVVTSQLLQEVSSCVTNGTLKIKCDEDLL